MKMMVVVVVGGVGGLELGLLVLLPPPERLSLDIVERGLEPVGPGFSLKPSKKRRMKPEMRELLTQKIQKAYVLVLATTPTRTFRF